MNRILAVMVLVAPGLVYADEFTPRHPYLTSKWFASIGLFAPDQNVKLTLDASVEVGDPTLFEEHNFSETFGVSSSDETFSAEIGWRFSRNWQLRGQYFRVGDNSQAVLEEDIQWGDYVFDAGSSVGAGVDMQITRVFFGRTFRSNESNEFGLGLGSHILDLSAYVRGNGSLDGEDVGFVNERASISQPLPNIGVWFAHAFSPKLALTARLDWLAASFDRYDGHIINAAASFGYAVSDHFGIGLAYNFFEIDFNVDHSNWKGGIRTRFDGPYVSLSGYW